ncbi:MAG: putative quinol monooxygenase [Acidimicrobiales bacterium]
MSEQIVVVVPIKAAEGKGNDVVAAFAPCIEETVKEDGCVKYALHRDKSNPDRLVHVEVWRSQADLDAHFQTPHLTALLGAMGTPGLLADAPDLIICAPENLGGDKGTL